VRVQRLIAAAATLAGRSMAEPEDLWPLVFALPTAEQQALVRTVLKQQLDASTNDVTPGAAREATQGRAARAKLLEERAGVLLTAELRDAQWRLKLEGVARDIDAAFSADALPEGLKSRRALIVEALG
jgi:MoxR-like ATPase